mgnify:FL=1
MLRSDVARVASGGDVRGREEKRRRREREIAEALDWLSVHEVPQVRSGRAKCGKELMRVGERPFARSLFLPPGVPYDLLERTRREERTAFPRRLPGALPFAIEASIACPRRWEWGTSADADEGVELGGGEGRKSGDGEA